MQLSLYCSLLNVPLILVTLSLLVPGFLLFWSNISGIPEECLDHILPRMNQDSVSVLELLTVLTWKLLAALLPDGCTDVFLAAF